jgi:hypothetical protein
MPKVVYKNSTGLIEEPGSGVDVKGGVSISTGDSADSLKSLDVTRNFTLKASPTKGVNEVSGSLMILRGRDEGLFFHLGGDQYISNNSWFDANSGAWGAWKFATGSGNHSAFRWGFRSKGRFDLDVASGGSEGDTINWTTAMAVTSSNGYVGIGKVDADSSELGSFNARLDISGSFSKPAVAITGSLDVGGGAGDAFFMLPRLTTSERDALSAKNGMMIYNTTLFKFQGYQAGSWQNLIA